MTEIKDFLKELIAAPGLSGYEMPVRSMIERTWSPLVDEIQTSRLGSLHALRKGGLPEPRPSLLLAAHMDAIGLMVSEIMDGFLRLTSIGGLDPRVLPGQMVNVHGRTDLPGMIIQPPAHLLPADSQDKTVALEYLWADVGLLPSQVQRQVRIGDLVSFAQKPFEMGKDLLAGHSLDNRASVAALTACLEFLQGRQLGWDLWAVATAQEEETLGGAATSAYQLRPSLAVAIDVTFGASPGSPSHATFPVGKGITLGWGPNIHPKLFSAFKDLAERLEIPTKIEVMPMNSGTDAMALQVAAEGIPSMVIGIPLKYMHTPVEVVSMKDIHRTGRLLAEFAAMLDEHSLEQLSLDD